MTHDDFDRFEAFYSERAALPRLELTPYADPSLLRLLEQRRYTVAWVTNVYASDPSAFQPAVSAVHIEPVGDSTAAEYADTLTRGFQEGAEPDPAWVRYALADLDRPDSLSLLARIDGRPAGAGSMAVTRDASGSVATRFGASVRPEFHRRGVQSALVSRRLEHARESGCDLAVIQCRPGTQSERNIVRSGFCLAYTKVVVSADVSP